MRALALLMALLPVDALGCDAVTVDLWGEVATQLPACETEDSTNCVWDAAARGDGTGSSFIVVEDATSVTYLYEPVDGGMQIETYLKEFVGHAD